jgi:NADH:ubiquinone oxidoreductase subunit E
VSTTANGSKAAVTKGYELPPELVSELEELATHYPERRAALIPALHRCQKELGGWISPEIMEACAELFGLEPVEVFGVASFYPMFHLRPRGRHLVGVCHNISCSLRGAEDVLARACEAAGCARPGATSPDGEFTVVRVECQGACTNAPMLDLDGTYHENLGPGDVERILGEARNGGAS